MVEYVETRRHPLAHGPIALMASGRDREDALTRHVEAQGGKH